MENTELNSEDEYTTIRNEAENFIDRLYVSTDSHRASAVMNKKIVFEDGTNNDKELIKISLFITSLVIKINEKNEESMKIDFKQISDDFMRPIQNLLVHAAHLPKSDKFKAVIYINYDIDRLTSSDNIGLMTEFRLMLETPSEPSKFSVNHPIESKQTNFSLNFTLSKM